MNLFLIFPGFIIVFIIVFCYECIIRQTEPRNKVHFYVTCELNHRGEIIHTLWLGKPCYKEGKGFVSDIWSSILAVNASFVLYNLNHSDFEDMKNGEIREVFLNLED